MDVVFPEEYHLRVLMHSFHDKFMWGLINLHTGRLSLLIGKRTNSPVASCQPSVAFALEYSVVNNRTLTLILYRLLLREILITYTELINLERTNLSTVRYRLLDSLRMYCFKVINKRNTVQTLHTLKYYFIKWFPDYCTDIRSVVLKQYHPSSGTFRSCVFQIAYDDGLQQTRRYNYLSQICRITRVQFSTRRPSNITWTSRAWWVTDSTLNVWPVQTTCPLNIIFKNFIMIGFHHHHKLE